MDSEKLGIECPHCGEIFSKESEHCTKCGRKRKPYWSGGPGEPILGIGITGILGFLIGSIPVIIILFCEEFHYDICGAFYSFLGFGVWHSHDNLISVGYFLLVIYWGFFLIFSIKEPGEINTFVVFLLAPSLIVMVLALLIYYIQRILHPLGCSYSSAGQSFSLRYHKP